MRIKMRFMCMQIGKEKGGFNLQQIPTDDCIVVSNDAKRPTIRLINQNYPSISISSEDDKIVEPTPPKPAPVTNGKLKDKEKNNATVEDESQNAKTVAVSDIVNSEPEKPYENERKQGIRSSKEDSSQAITDIKYHKYEKDKESITLIKKALNANDFIKNLMDEERLASVVEAMNPREYEIGSFIIKEGEQGSHLFVSAQGNFEVIKNGKIVKKFGPGEAFGELAILYKAKRFASVKVTSKAKVWVLERNVFKKIMLRSGKQEQEDNLKFLSCVPILEGIHQTDLIRISDLLKREFFLAGTMIVRQGEKGDKFYIIRGGTVVISKRPPDGGPEEFVKEISRGDYFGEQALLHEDRRLATVTAKAPGVECLTLDRIPFNEYLGNIKELRDKRHTVSRPSNVSKKPVIISSEYEHVQLDELEIVGTLGVGGFGRVELVQYNKDRKKTFALKCLKKVEVVQQQQQEHAFNEKSIMIRCNSPFICKLYKTYKDNKYLYFLMEPVLGGDVWTILQKKRFFNEQTSRFMTACVVEALEHLHGLDIIYRDLKPENLMLDSKGYVKLVDFGYAKIVPTGSKSYTFAGTPEYVAPEIVLNKGHDRAVDYWALGIFVHELLSGKPPFRGTNHMKTYNLILRGIDAIEFNPKISKVAQLLIRKLCKPVPIERLGYLRNGIKDIKNHKWFLGFDWDKLRNRAMPAPLIRPISSPTDLNNFEKYPKDKLPPDEMSGWDIDF